MGGTDNIITNVASPGISHSLIPNYICLTVSGYVVQWTLTSWSPELAGHLLYASYYMPAT